MENNVILSSNSAKAAIFLPEGIQNIMRPVSENLALYFCKYLPLGNLYSITRFVRSPCLAFSNKCA